MDTLCRNCRHVLTHSNRVQCSLQYKCKVGDCSNRYPCRRNDLCTDCHASRHTSHTRCPGQGSSKEMLLDYFFEHDMDDEDSRLCRICNAILTYNNRVQCSLQYKCKTGDCSNQYPCRRSDLCTDCKSNKTMASSTAVSPRQLLMEFRKLKVQESRYAQNVGMGATNRLADPTPAEASRNNTELHTPDPFATVSPNFSDQDKPEVKTLTRLRISTATSATQRIPKVSLSEYFHLLDNIAYLHDVFAGTEESKRLAWLGDSIVDGSVAAHVFTASKTANIGELTLRKARYVCNKTMATFLDVATDASERMRPGLSDHSKGTIFEALVGATATVAGRRVAKQVIGKYIKFVDENEACFSFPVAAAPPMTMWTYRNQRGDAPSVIDDSFGTLDSSETYTTVLWSVCGSLAKADDKVASTRLSDMMQCVPKFTAEKPVPATHETGSECSNARDAHDIDTAAQLGCSHSQEPVAVAWRSRKGYTHHDAYMQCCGVRAGRHACLRHMWPDASAKHTGELKIGGSNKAGGGMPQASNHIPRGSIPTWTCCHATAMAPGCVSEVYTLPRCRDLAREWLDQYDRIVAREKAVAVTFQGTAAVGS